MALQVNGRLVEAAVAPRMHLADFLREELRLTGTHVGCEHGVCGACTVLLNGAPARSCITYAAMCDGVQVVTIEGLADDAAMAALRAEFAEGHALQCGYCTPGMLVTARDIVRRLPDADDDRVRLELAGNLCRCTGYNGIVKAIRRVLDMRLNFEVAPVAALPVAAAPVVAAVGQAKLAEVAYGDGTRLRQVLQVAVTEEALWAALQDPALVASCVPGAVIKAIEGTRLVGEVVVSLGPLQGRFVGHADVVYGARRGEIRGEGQDQMTKTRLSAEAVFGVSVEGDFSVLTLEIAYSLRGPLAQFARGPVVRAFVDEMASMVAKNLAARLRGEVAAAPRRMGGVGLLVRILWRRVRIVFGR